MHPRELHDLLPNHFWWTLPPIASTSGQKDPIARLRYFTPWTDWTWYVIEATAEDEDGAPVPFDDEGASDVRCFGLVAGQEIELGYWLMSELSSIRGPGGLTVERDLYFTPAPLSEVRLKHAR